MVYLHGAGRLIVALDARTGAVRWETKTSGGMTRASIVVEGKVISGRACAPNSENCYIAAHDAKTGKEAVAVLHGRRRSNEPGGDDLGGCARRDACRVDVGPAGRLRSGSAG